MRKKLALLILSALICEMGSPLRKPAQAQQGDTAQQKTEQKNEKLQLVVKEKTALPIVAATFSPDQKYIVTGASDGTVCVWDNIQGSEVQRIKEHSDGIRKIVFSPDAESFVTASDDGTALLWKILSQEEQAAIKSDRFRKPVVKKLLVLKHGDPVIDAAFAPDGKSILTTSGDWIVLLWDARTGRLQQELKHENAVNAIGFSPDGRTIVVTDMAGSIQFYETSSGKPLSTLRGSVESVVTAAFSPDGRILATGAGNGAIRMWDVETGREIRSLNIGGFSINKMSFSPEGRRIISLSRY